MKKKNEKGGAGAKAEEPEFLEGVRIQNPRYAGATVGEVARVVFRSKKDRLGDKAK